MIGMFKWLATVETKVWAAGVGAGSGGLIGTAIVWGLGVGLWHADASAAASDAAIAAVPAPIAALVPPAVAFVGALGFGYKAPPSNHAGNNPGVVMDDTSAGHVVVPPEEPPVDDDGPGPDELMDAHLEGH